MKNVCLKRPNLNVHNFSNSITFNNFNFNSRKIQNRNLRTSLKQSCFLLQPNPA